MARSPILLAGAGLICASLIGCTPADPVIPEKWVDPPPATHQPRPMPKATHEGVGEEGSLLEGYEERSPSKDEDLEQWILPYQSRAAIAELLITVADDDPESLRRLFSDNATWGVPDRRKIGARPIYTADDPLGVEFLTAFRSASMRFKKRARFTLEPLPGFEMFAATGAEPVWASYASDDGLDIIGLRLIMERGQLKIDYVGFFVERPSNPIRVPNAGDPPPVIPYIKMPVSLAPADAGDSSADVAG